MVQNNLLYIAMENLDAAVCQVCMRILLVQSLVIGSACLYPIAQTGCLPAEAFDNGHVCGLIIYVG